jgi:hypothetical protein
VFHVGSSFALFGVDGGNRRSLATLFEFEVD